MQRLRPAGQAVEEVAEEYKTWLGPRGGRPGGAGGEELRQAEEERGQQYRGVRQD